MRPWFYPRDGARVFWLPFAARIVGIGRTAESLKSLALARVRSRPCRGLSYMARAITPKAADVGRNSRQESRIKPRASGGSGQYAPQECGDRAQFVRVDRVLHRVLVPLDVVAERLQAVA